THTLTLGSEAITCCIQQLTWLWQACYNRLQQPQLHHSYARHVTDALAHTARSVCACASSRCIFLPRVVAPAMFDTPLAIRVQEETASLNKDLPARAHLAQLLFDGG